MDLSLLIVSTTAMGILVILVLGAFLWAAKKDGDEDKALQRRLGITRKTWL